MRANGEAVPYYTEPTFICEVELGAQLIAVRYDIILVQPTKPPMYVTPTGLVPIHVCKEVPTNG